MALNNSFDFGLLNYIAADDLRDSLLSDYREMEAASKAESWKCVQVLAGSIIEALLIDYLLAINYSGKTESEILKMELSQTISACLAERLLDSTTDNLCIVIRDYRNLIHPGRIMRLQTDVTQESAEIAIRLVKMIAWKIAKRRQEQYGYTAQEVMAKIEGDSVAFPMVLPALLKKLPDSERKRLLFKMLPERNSQLRANIEAGHTFGFDPATDNQISCLSVCFRELIKVTDSDTLRELGRKYIRILQSGTEAERRHYELSFFRASDIPFIASGDQETVITHMFSILNNLTLEYLECIDGIGKYVSNAKPLEPQFDAIINAAIENTNIDEIKIIRFLNRVVSDLEKDMLKSFQKRLEKSCNRVAIFAPNQSLYRIQAIQREFGFKVSVRESESDTYNDGDPIPF